MNKFLKGLILGLVSIVLLATVFATYKAESQNTNQRIFDGIMVTSGGTSGGELIAWLNTGGNNYIKGYLPRASVDTGWNNTGSDTIIPSEKLVWSLVSGFGNYFPLAGNSISNPITGPLYMGDSTGSFNVEIGTTQLNFGAVLDAYGPIIRPKSYVYGVGEKPILAVEGTMFFKGVTGEDVHVYVSNSDGTRATMFRQRYDDKFSIDIYSGSLLNQTSSFSFLGDGRLQTDIDISSIISADEDFITKKYAYDKFFPRTNIDTGFNHTGSDTIIPSEKTVRGLVDNLTNNYIPYRSGDRLLDSPLQINTTNDIILSGEGNLFLTNPTIPGNAITINKGDSGYGGIAIFNANPGLTIIGKSSIGVFHQGGFTGTTTNSNINITRTNTDGGQYNGAILRVTDDGNSNGDIFSFGNDYLGVKNFYMTSGWNLNMIGNSFFSGDVNITGNSFFSGDVNITGNTIVDGYTQLGSDAPKIKIKKLIIQTPDNEGGSIGVYHNLDADKIISVTAKVTYNPGNAVFAGQGNNVAGYMFRIRQTDTTILVNNHATDSENILSKQCIITIFYEE